MKCLNILVTCYLSLVSTISSLLAAEIVLRSINYPQLGCSKISDVSEIKLASFDKDLGWSYIPFGSTEGDYGSYYTFNKEGYRVENADHSTDFSKPIILIIGDSMLFGHGLDFKDTF